MTITAALASLKNQHKSNWLVFTGKIDALLRSMEKRMGCSWSSSEDITEHISDEDFAAAGFTAAEALALKFALTEDCMGQPVNSAEMVERWFCYGSS